MHEFNLLNLNRKFVPCIFWSVEILLTVRYRCLCDVCNIYSAAVFIWLCEVEVQVEKHKALSMRGEGVSEEMDFVQQKPLYLHIKNTLLHICSLAWTYLFGSRNTRESIDGELCHFTVFACLPHSFCWQTVKHMW